MDAADPLCAISSPTRLLPRTLGPASPAASPSKAREVLREAISRARPLKGSKELVEQARMVLKGHEDIQMLYHDDGVKAGAPANGKKDQQGRRPGLDRKRGRKGVPAVDRSNVLKIKDPNEYYKKLDDLEEAEKEIKRLNGEVVDDITMNFDPVVEPKRRFTLLGRKSVRTFKLIDDADTQDPIEISASQTGTLTGSQLTQDDAHTSAAGENEQFVPSRPGQCAISDVSEKEDSLVEKDRDDLSYLLTLLQNMDEPDEEEFFRKTLGIGKIRKEKVCLRNSIPGDRSQRSNTVRNNSMRVPLPESSLPQSCQSRVSELEKHLFPGDAANDKCADLQEDDDSEGSPDIVMGEQPLVHDSSDVLMIDETFTAVELDKMTPNLSFKAAEHVIHPEPNMADCAEERQTGGSPLGLCTASEYDRETPNAGVKATEHVLDPEPSMPDHADERQAGGSPLGLYSDTEVAKGNAACSRSNISIEEDNVPIDHPIDMSNNEVEVSSSHHLEGSSAEVLVRTSVKYVASDGIDRTSHAAEDNIQHPEVVEEDGIIQDKSSHPSEIPLEDIDQANQSQMHGGNNKKSAADLRNAQAPIKEKRQAAQKGKKKQQSKRSQKVSDESNHSLEISQENFDSENRPHMDENIEQQTVAMSSALSPNKAKAQKGAQRRNRTKQSNQRKSLGDAGLAWQSGVRRSTRIRSRPLEHWLGERFLYGRIHDTMATVIGIKAYSPGQDGKKTLKVKSFVPEQYSDLVTESAKY
ncbi:uncharacterized protein C2845_PM07G15890 [Panicum miliaceum]|uniref:Centromere protein C n=1 Tax=Panicum miliaceum TaxID=4540 RepID=A0A3L6SRH0_PANMI|nr:uncharacterized protein C2845_PM07G15890 [Panicum miliaceum]